MLPEDIRQKLSEIFGVDESLFKDAGQAPPPRLRNAVREDPAQFEHNLRSEAQSLGLDPDAIARKAVEDAVKRKRIDAWIEDNRKAMEANAKDLRENGLWSDGYRLF